MATNSSLPRGKISHCRFPVQSYCDNFCRPNKQCSSNTTISQRRRLLLSNDVATHPGPKDGNSPFNPTTQKIKGARRVRNPCVACERGVTAASKAVDCDNCSRWTHLRCADDRISANTYDHYVESGADFLCDSCFLAALPFSGEEFGDVAAPAQSLGSGPTTTTNEEDDDGRHSPCNNEHGDAAAVSGDGVAATSLASSKGLTLLHINVRSLLPKLTEIRILLRDSNAAFLAVTESWLDKTVGEGEINVDGYNFVWKDRNRHGGGVGIYIREGISFNLRPDLDDPDVECIFIDVMFPKTKPFLVGAWYRPPDNGNFLDKFKDIIGRIPSGTEMYILGDYVFHGITVLLGRTNAYLICFLSIKSLKMPHA